MSVFSRLRRIIRPGSIPVVMVLGRTMDERRGEVTVRPNEEPRGAGGDEESAERRMTLAAGAEDGTAGPEAGAVTEGVGASRGPPAKLAAPRSRPVEPI